MGTSVGRGIDSILCGRRATVTDMSQTDSDTDSVKTDDDESAIPEQNADASLREDVAPPTVASQSGGSEATAGSMAATAEADSESPSDALAPVESTTAESDRETWPDGIEEAPPRSVFGTNPIRPTGSLLTGAAALLGLTGAGIGLAIALLLVPDLVSFSATNSLDKHLRDRLCLIILGTGLLFALVPGIYLLIRRSRVAAERVHRIARILCPLGLVGPLPALFNWKVFASQELVLVVTVTCWGLGLERALRTCVGALEGVIPALPRRANRILWKLTWVPVVALVLWFAIFCSYYTVMAHYRMQTTAYDLGIFDNVFYNLTHGEFFKATPDLRRGGGPHLQLHVTWVAYLLLPFYALRQQADTLLVMQAVIVALGAIPYFLLARFRAHSALFGLLICYLYITYAPTHGPVFYDFHFLTIAPAFVGWVIYCFETKRRIGLAIAWVLAMSVREDISATLAALGLFYLLQGQRMRWAAFFVVTGTAYLFLMRFWMMPAVAVHPDEFHAHVGMYLKMIAPGHRGYGAVIRTILTNLVFTLEQVLEERRLTYLLELTVPFLLLPLRHRRTWILLIPAALVCLMSTHPAPFLRQFQYTALWVPFLILGTVVVMSEWKQSPGGKSKFWAALIAMALTGTVLSYQQGALFQQNDFKGGYRKVQFEFTEADRQRLERFRSVIAEIPPDASVLTTENEGPHLSNRPDCFTLRAAYTWADYLVININEARSGRSQSNLRQGLKTGQYGFVKQVGEYQLWKRGAPHTNDERGLRAVRIHF